MRGEHRVARGGVDIRRQVARPGLSVTFAGERVDPRPTVFLPGPAAVAGRVTMEDFRQDLDGLHDRGPRSVEVLVAVGEHHLPVPYGAQVEPAGQRFQL